MVKANCVKQQPCGSRWTPLKPLHFQTRTTCTRIGGSSTTKTRHQSLCSNVEQHWRHIFKRSPVVSPPGIHLSIPPSFLRSFHPSFLSLFLPSFLPSLLSFFLPSFFLPLLFCLTCKLEQTQLHKLFDAHPGLPFDPLVMAFFELEELGMEVALATSIRTAK